MKIRANQPARVFSGLLLAACVCFSTRARADYEPNKYVEPNTNQVLEYNLYVPANLAPGSKYPLLVYLHAANDEAMPHRTLASDGKGWVPQLIRADQGKTTAFYMIPISQSNASGWGDPLAPISAAEKFEGRLTVVALKQLLEKYPIDPERLYVSGASMGARGTYDLLRRYPDLFAAGAPCASPALPADAAVYAAQNIWAVMGSEDPVAQPNRDTITAIRKVCGNPIYTELAGHGHDSWRSIYPMPEFIAWMFAQRRGVPWERVSQPPTPAQILAAELAPTKGLSADQPIVSRPMSCPVGMAGAAGAGGGASAAGAGGVAGAEALPSAGQGGIAGSDIAAGGVGEQAASAGRGGMPNEAGGASSGGARTSAGASAAGLSNAAGDSAADSASGCSCRVVPSSAARIPWRVIALLAASAKLRRKRRT